MGIVIPFRFTDSERSELMRLIGKNDVMIINEIESVVLNYLWLVRSGLNESKAKPRDVANYLARISEAGLALCKLVAPRGKSKLAKEALGIIAESASAEAFEALKAHTEMQFFITDLQIIMQNARFCAEQMQKNLAPARAGRPTLRADQYFTRSALSIWVKCGNAVGQSRPAPDAKRTPGPAERYLAILGTIARRLNPNIKFKAAASLRAYNKGHPERRKGNSGRPKKIAN